MSFFFRFIFLFSIASSVQAKNTPTRGNSFNPNIGINALTLYQSSNRGGESYAKNRNGVGIQEAELQFSADVDPYWRLVSTFSLHQEVTVDSSTTPPTRTAENVFEAEELFAESLDLPYVTLKVGKFKSAFGKHNLFHTHAYPFIDAPLMNTTLLGEEGLNDAGVSVSALLPFSWFSEVTLQALSGQGEGLDYFHSPSANSRVTVAHWKNLWDLTDDLTFEMGMSSASGENSKDTTKLVGGDITFKWRGDKSQAVAWSTEMINRSRREATDEKGSGIASWMQYQFAHRWWAQIRTENLEVKDQDPASLAPIPTPQRKNSVLLGFIPTEFSGIRVQYYELDDNTGDKEKNLLVQFNFSIGAHPAHAY